MITNDSWCIDQSDVDFMKRVDAMRLKGYHPILIAFASERGEVITTVRGDYKQEALLRFLADNLSEPILDGDEQEQ